MGEAVKFKKFGEGLGNWSRNVKERLQGIWPIIVEGSYDQDQLDMINQRS